MSAGLGEVEGVLPPAEPAKAAEEVSHWGLVRSTPSQLI